ncbi:MAG: NAD-dependent epimerase/dehydratase family protein [Clostridia bacterium]|nr:NAD-dependent epimerase/dehydratase family protein [Clostridia bacterium]
MELRWETIHSAVVNGCLGTIGLALVRCLLRHGVRVYAVAYPGDQRISLIPEKATVVPLDMREIEKLKDVIPEKVDAFFHLAWMGTIGPGRDDMMLQTENIRCAVLAARAAQQLGCHVFVGTGSQAEYGRIEGLVKPDSPCFPLNGYGIGKLCAGQMTRIECRKLGVRHEWARILSIYGPGDGPLSVMPTIISKLLNREKPVLTGGEQLWDFLYCDDAAQALYRMAAWGKDGQVYPVGSGQVKTLREYFEIARDAVDPQLPLGIGELPYPKGQVMHLQADLTPLQEDTGFAPAWTFEEGIRETVRWFRAQQQ